MRVYEWRTIVGFADTNVVGNVYFSHIVAWQGRCREMFLRDHAPEVAAELQSGLALSTTRCACEFYGEFVAFDAVVVRMHLAHLVQNRMGLGFDYLVEAPEGLRLVARGSQEIACMRRIGSRLDACAIPLALRSALEPYLRPNSSTPAGGA
jgi:enediyne biosynthesis thioesterase